MPPKILSNAAARRALQSKQSEDDVQQSIITLLRLKGYEVLQTSEHRRRVQCPHCTQWSTPYGGSGCDKGVPDLIVSRDSWPAGTWLGIEVKGPKTKVSAAQKTLAELNRIFIVRSATAALEVVIEFERSLK